MTEFHLTHYQLCLIISVQWLFNDLLFIFGHWTSFPIIFDLSPPLCWWFWTDENYSLVYMIIRCRYWQKLLAIGMYNNVYTTYLDRYEVWFFCAFWNGKYVHIFFCVKTEINCSFWIWWGNKKETNKKNDLTNTPLLDIYIYI